MPFSFPKPKKKPVDTTRPSVKKSSGAHKRIIKRKRINGQLVGNT